MKKNFIKKMSLMMQPRLRGHRIRKRRKKRIRRRTRGRRKMTRRRKREGMTLMTLMIPTAVILIVKLQSPGITRETRRVRRSRRTGLKIKRSPKNRVLQHRTTLMTSIGCLSFQLSKD